MPKQIKNRMEAESGHSRVSKWRVGQKLGRTIYEQKDRYPSELDRFLGIMETPELAAHVVALHNKFHDEAD